MSLAFEMKTFSVLKGVILKSHKLCQIVNFENLEYNYSNWHPACTVEHFVNIFTV